MTEKATSPGATPVTLLQSPAPDPDNSTPQNVGARPVPPPREARGSKRSRLATARGRPANDHATAEGLAGAADANQGMTIEQTPLPDNDALVGDQFFRQMVQCMRNGVLAVTRDGRVAVMNEVAYRVFGLEPSPGDIGRQFADVLRDQPDVVRILGSAFELNHLPNRAELRLKSSRKVIGYTLSRIADTHGQPSGAALFFKDLTRVEQLEERERLRDRLAALGEMAAAIAHELKNPLAGIEVMAGLLKRQLPDSPDVQELLTEIINETKLANATVLEVLEFVRPIRLEMERTSIAQVLHDAVRIAESKVSRRDVRVTMSVQSHLPLIQGDHHQLCRLFTNLLINAFEALNGTGTISITAASGPPEEDHSGSSDAHAVPTIVIEVADNGPGVPPDIVDRVFNPFFTTKPQGSGLGLAIVRKVVDAHDGRIDVTSNPEHGTAFRVTLPMSTPGEWYQ
jgi:signal transduction histidine kinase